MLSLKDLAERYELTPKQARRLWENVGPLLGAHTRRGPQGQTLIDVTGLPIIERCQDLVRQGASLPNAVRAVAQEMGLNGYSGKVSDGLTKGTDDYPAIVDLLKAQLSDKDHRISDLTSERDRLLNIIENQGEQIKALMPGPKPEPRRSRFEALRFALLGR